MTAASASVSYEHRLEKAFDSVAYPLVRVFSSCPQFCMMGHGDRLAPFAPPEVSQKLDELMAKYLDSGKEQDLDLLTFSAYQAIHIRSVNYSQADVMVRFGAALGQALGRATLSTFHGMVSTARDRSSSMLLRLLFQVSCDDTDVPSTVCVSDSDEIGVLPVAAIHNGIRAHLPLPVHAEWMLHNFEILRPRFWSPRDASKSPTLLITQNPIPPPPLANEASKVAELGAINVVSAAPVAAPTAKEATTDANAVATAAREQIPPLVPTAFAAYLVNCDYQCLAACEHTTGKKCKKRTAFLHRKKDEEHPLTKVCRDMVTAQAQLDFVAQKTSDRPIVTYLPSLKTCADLAKRITAATATDPKHELDFTVYEETRGGGVCFAVRRVPAGTSLEARAVHLAAALYNMEFTHQSINPHPVVVNSQLLHTRHSHYIRELVGSLTRTRYEHAWLLHGKDIIALMPVLNRLFDQAAKVTATAAATSGDAPSKTAPAPGSTGANPNQKRSGPRQRKRGAKGKSANDSKTATGVAEVGCVSCPKTADSASSLY